MALGLRVQLVPDAGLPRLDGSDRRIEPLLPLARREHLDDGEGVAHGRGGGLGVRRPAGRQHEPRRPARPGVEAARQAEHGAGAQDRARRARAPAATQRSRSLGEDLDRPAAGPLDDRRVARHAADDAEDRLVAVGPVDADPERPDRRLRLRREGWLSMADSIDPSPVGPYQRQESIARDVGGSARLVT